MTDANYPNQLFFHPFIQSASMFIGCIIVLVPYWVRLGFRKWKKTENMLIETGEPIQATDHGITKKPPINPVLLLIPSLMMNIAGTLLYVALTMVAASVF